MQAKYDEAMKPTTGTLRKIMGGTVTTEKLDQMRKRLKVAARKASDAKNEYLLGLEAVNKHQHYYHQIVLPQLMRVRQRQARACTRTRLAGRLTLQTPHARMSPPPPSAEYGRHLLRLDQAVHHRLRGPRVVQRARERGASAVVEGILGGK